MEFSLELGKQVLRRTPQVLDAMLTELSEDWIHSSEGPLSWTPYQVVGHLLYVEENDWISRTRVILDAGATQVFEPIDREAGFARFQDMGLSDLLKRFEVARNSNLISLDSLVQEKDLDKEGSHPDFGEVTSEPVRSNETLGRSRC